MAKGKKKKELKKEYSEVLNAIFGTNIKWEKLSIKELEELSRALTDNKEIMCSKVCGEVGTKLLKILKNIVNAIPSEYEGPLIKLAKMALKDV